MIRNVLARAGWIVGGGRRRTAAAAPGRVTTLGSEAQVRPRCRGYYAGEGGGDAVTWVPPEPKLPPGRRREPLIGTDGRILLKGLPLQQLRQWCASLGLPPSKADQIWRAMYIANGGVSSWWEARDGGVIGKQLLARLEPIARLDGGLELIDVHESQDGTRKMVLRTETSPSPTTTAAASSEVREQRDEGRRGGAGPRIEAVLIPMGPAGDHRRSTLCVSSQIGCAMNCKFCFTGRLGLLCDLNTAQIVEQVMIARRISKDEGHKGLNNIVFMGMGEPLQNLPAVLPALDIITAQPGLQFSPGRITVSTSGLVPQLHTLATAHPGVQLAVSLNATTDEIRTRLMPVNRKWPLEELMAALRRLFPADQSLSLRLGRRTHVFLEYIMLQGVNDSVADARRLVRLVEGTAAKINLIEFNEHEGTGMSGSSAGAIAAFKQVLVDAGCFVTLRNSKGDDQMAACGQLGEAVFAAAAGASQGHAWK